MFFFKNYYLFIRPTKFSKVEELAKKIALSSSQMTGGHNHHNYEQGSYNNYKYRPESYLKGNICKNYIEYDGIVLGKFYCPIEGYDQDETECCGYLNEQYCCKPIKPKNKEDKFVLFKSYYIIIISIVFGLLFSIGIGVAIFFMCKARIKAKDDLNNNGEKGNLTDEDENDDDDDGLIVEDDLEQKQDYDNVNSKMAENTNKKLLNKPLNVTFSSKTNLND